MQKFNSFDGAIIVLILIGGLNWGLVGFFGFDLVAAVFGAMSVVTRIIYALVGLAALYAVFGVGKWGKK
ncbi:MAG: DUF378 domain-containing protein [Candidatus Komeilibacteria bacterium]